MVHVMDGGDADRGYVLAYLVAAAKAGLVRPELAVIAREAGVSPGSVRAVLQGAACSPGMRERVLRVLGLEEGAAP